ncbi:MAG: aldo/keto reductase [Firmicutes bacterium]|nr:aldo/keto reductase [Bacillota bacterium]
MKKVRLGKTGLYVTKPAMGCLPIQRAPMDEAVRILRRAFTAGINYFDTANMYTDSEEKLGRALGDVRHEIIISTKSQARDKKTAAAHIDNSLKMLKTDYIDLFQFHMADNVPDPDDPDGAFAAALEAKRAGKILHIGITAHLLDAAFAQVESGYFETMQFPFSYLATERELALAALCKEKDMGFIAMKGLAGGLLTDARACCAFLEQYDNVVPIWGVETMAQLLEWIALGENPPVLDDALLAVIEQDRAELSGAFCRSCGYCMPCAVDIEICNCARMKRLIRRMPSRLYLTDDWRAKMRKIEDCIDCGLCKTRCPYGLDIPNLLRENLRNYDEFCASHFDSRSEGVSL